MPQIDLQTYFRSSPFLEETDTRVPVISPTVHWATTARAFAETGGLVSGDDLAELIRHRCEENDELSIVQPVSLVARWIVSHSVVSIESPWGFMLPLFQFDVPRAAVHACMRPLLSDLRGVFEETELALWFVTPNDWLSGACPAQAMLGDLQSVRRAARTDRFVAVGI
ncbi:MAG: hypothetical protein Q8M77_05110 [Hydrogenophaga sp.]|nr:hypothetical protein [Hydrogenophaga sp.]